MVKINDILEKWYSKNKRHFWWREKRDTYTIWIGEIIFQQTRISQGDEYLKRFLDRFPDVRSLASADEGEVMKMWQGLGYYSRARNLHRAAQLIVAEYGGRFPGTYSAWLSVPGVGPYTAAMIASLACGEKKAAADGNIQRVVARWKMLPHQSASAQLMNEVVSILGNEMGEMHPGVFNEAMMDLGATVCLPKNPLCTSCPFAKHCQAFLKRKTHLYPVRKTAAVRKTRKIVYLMIPCKKGLIMRKRKGMGIWESLYDFPSLEYDKPWPAKKRVAEDLNALLRQNNGYIVYDKQVHKLTHMTLELEFLLFGKGTLPEKNKEWICISQNALQRFAFPVPVEKILKSLGNKLPLFL